MTVLYSQQVLVLSGQFLSIALASSPSLSTFQEFLTAYPAYLHIMVNVYVQTAFFNNLFLFLATLKNYKMIDRLFAIAVAATLAIGLAYSIVLTFSQSPGVGIRAAEILPFPWGNYKVGEYVP